MKKLRVNIISETEFSVKGHGVHTAYIEHANSLRSRSDAIVNVNGRAAADVTHLHTFGLYALWKLLFGSGKKVVTAHVVPASWIGSIKYAKLWAPLGERYLRYFYNKADAVVAVSADVKRELETSVGVTSPITVVHNTIDTAHYRRKDGDRQRAREVLGIEPGAFVVVSNGQIQPRKRFDLFCTLAGQMSDVQFIWVGGVPFKQLGDDYEHIQRLIVAAPPNLRVTGVIDLAAVRDYYHAADVFFLPSIQETFGLVVVEAAAAGLPVVLRDIADYKNTFGDDALKGDDATFAALIERLRNDKHLYEQYVAASQRIAQRFDSREGAEQIMKLYRSLMDEDKRS